MTKVYIRKPRSDEKTEILALNRLAFGRDDEACLLDALHAEGGDLLSYVAILDGAIRGHIQFFPIRIDGVDGAAGLGPMCVHPDAQGQKIGTRLVKTGLAHLPTARSPVFVLGHETYYPRFGFSADAARGFRAPWQGRAFMARCRSSDASSGTLTYPRAFSP